MSSPLESALNTDIPEAQTSFPIRPVFLAALLPALLGLSCGLFVLRPTSGFDAATGLLAWLNFTEGGTWNTIATPDPNNIAQTIEIPLTWWPPGQYLFLGLLHSLGLSLGGAVLLIAFLSTISGAVGLAALARDLGAPSKSLAWISGSYACSIYSLINFHHCRGGETLIMALWPWCALIAWRLRNHSIRLVCILPLLFLIGSFIKHSFAIYSICILSFLGIERPYKIISLKKESTLAIIKETIAVAIPLVISGILYIALRNYAIDTSETPKEGAPYYTYNIKEIWSHVPNSPFLSALEIRSTSLRTWSKLLSTNPEILRDKLTSLLSLISPISISIYLFLVFHKSPLARFSGITSIVTIAIYFSLHSIDYAISLDDRHYKQAGSLLLATIAAQAAGKGRVALLARIIIIGSITWGTARFAQLTYVRQKPTSGIYLAENGFAVSLDRALREELRSSLTQLEKNSIFLLPRPDLVLDLFPIRPESVRFMPIMGHGFYLAESYKGRVPEIIIVYPLSWEMPEDAIKARFEDYDKAEWYSYTIADCTFLRTRPPLAERSADLIRAEESEPR